MTKKEHDPGILPIQTKRTSLSTPTFIALATTLATFIFVMIFYLFNIQFRGWVHRCLRPSNLFINKNRRNNYLNDENVVNFGLPGTKFTNKNIDEIAEEAQQQLEKRPKTDL